MNFVYLVLLAAAWVWIECFIGGTRLIFSIPAYAVISVASILSLAGLFRKRTPPNASCLGATLLLGGWILWRASHSPVPYLALPDFLMMLGCLMVYLLTAFYFNGTVEQLTLVGLFVLIAAAEIWCGLIQFAKDESFMLFGLLRPQAIQRASGMFISPNTFAGYMVTVGILALSLGVWSRQRVWVRVLALYVSVFCLVGVAISGSRGGYFAAMGSLLCFVLGTIYIIRRADPRNFMIVAVCSLGGMAIAVGIAAVLMLHSQFLTGRLQTMVSRDVRIYNWEAALDHFRLSPWVGTGAGTHLIYGRLFRRPELQADPVHAHCDYLELLAEYGLAGGLCMLLFLVAHLRNGFRSFSGILRRLIPTGSLRGNRFAIQFGALCAVAGLAIHSIVDFDMHIPGEALVFGFLFGVLANPGMERPLGWMDRRVTGWLRLLPPVLGIWMLARALPLLPSEYCSEMARRSLRSHAFLDAIDFAQRGLGRIPPRSSDDAAGADLPPEDDLDKALRILGPNPGNPDLYFYLGEANRALGSRMANSNLRRHFYERAQGAFEKGLEIFPQDEDLLVRMGQVLDGMEDFSGAEGYYQKALAADPNLDLIYTYYAGHLNAEGKPAEANAVLEKRRETRRGNVVQEPRIEARLQ